MNKVFIEELWYIKNFLTEEEIKEIMRHANEKTGWYKTMRSKSIRNKWVGINIPLNPEGTWSDHHQMEIGGDCVFPEPDKRFPKIEKDYLIFNRENGIEDRLKEALPPRLVGPNALQSFWPLEGKELENGGGGAYDWHYEKGYQGVNDKGMTATWSLYINDDYEGGILEFKYKDITIKPKPGMLVSIPMTEEWTHRVTPVTNGVRHTLYGTCHEDIENRDISTSLTC